WLVWPSRLRSGLRAGRRVSIPPLRCVESDPERSSTGHPRLDTKRVVMVSNRDMKKIVVIGALALAGGSFYACQPSIDPATGLQLESVSTGWQAAGVVDGRNKLVPSVSFKLKNVSDRPLPSLQVNAVFRRIGEGGEWGSA